MQQNGTHAGLGLSIISVLFFDIKSLFFPALVSKKQHADLMKKLNHSPKPRFFTPQMTFAKFLCCLAPRLH